jgi:hypothetical protein
MEEIRVTGGARVGGVNASWPLARLVVSTTRLKLTSVLDTYEFLPSEVVSLERYGSIPFFSSGVRIAHAREDYPSKIIFWCLGNPETLIDQIRQVGFSPAAPASSEIKWRGLPVRWTAILLITLAWNGLFLLDHAFRHSFTKRPGLFTLLPLLFAFLICWGIKKSPELQKTILRDGRSVNEIKAFLSLIQFVSGLLLVVFTVLVLSHAFG